MKTNGFTLIEMMVALLIFAMLATAGVALLSFGVRAQAAATTRLDDIADTRRMAVLIASDLAQARPRTARALTGETVRAFTGNDGNSDPLIMGYVRGGRTNTEGAPRAALQRVDIVLSEGRLSRQTYPMVDGTAVSNTALLADRVASVAMRYRDREGSWRARWDNAGLTTLPAAVEMTVAQTGRPPLTFAWITGPTYP